jgi:glycogen(starch) synthase
VGTLKIVISTYTFHPDIGGVATTTAVLAEAFYAEGHDVTVATLTPQGDDHYPFRVVRDPGHLELYRLYRAADVVILSNLSLRLGYPMLFMRKPFALCHHSESAFHLSHNPISSDWLRAGLMRRARHLVTSEFVGRRSGLRRYYVSYPSTEVESILPHLVRPAPQRDGVLFVGRLEPEKGLLWLLDRWSVVARELGVGEMRIVGSGSLGSELERRIAAGEAPGVVFLGPMSRDRTAAEFGRAAYVMVPSLWEEPFGLVAVEGLAGGAVTIHSNRGGLPEATGDLGFSYNPDSEESFLAALRSARHARDDLRSSEQAEAQWALRCGQHLARFHPRNSVQTILGAVAR